MNINEYRPKTVYEEVPDWYLKKQELEKEKEKVKQQENSQLEFNIPFGWTE